jgi:glycine/D-amino acid oxidase-like deaminating enzyme
MAHFGGHAIVIGAGMGGLLAARALAEHYDRVTVIERDELPEAPEPRKGVTGAAPPCAARPGARGARTAVSWPDGRTRRGRGYPRR